MNLKYINLFPFYKRHIEELQQKTEWLFNQLLSREDRTCLLCTAKSFDDDLFTVHTLEPSDTPTLSNSVLVCQHCNSRVINNSVDNHKQFKLLFSPYLKRNSTKDFNETASADHKDI